MKSLPRVEPEDYKFVPVDPDPDFDPEHNKRVIAETIKENEKLRRRKDREYTEGIRERSEAVATYLKSLMKGGKSSKIDKYFGRRHLAYLRGQEIKDRIMDGLTVVDSQGNIIRKKGDIIKRV